MPAAFDRCYADGGMIKTVQLPDGKYRHTCVDKKGKTYLGAIKKKKAKKAK